MSFFSFNRGGQQNFWNFSQKDKDNYSTEIHGYLVELSDPPKTKFGSNTIERFQDGNPMRNIRMTILCDDGLEYNWDFNPGGADKSRSGGEDKRSNAMKAVTEAIIAAVPNATGLEDILGMRIQVITEEPPGNFTYSRQNPRPWRVNIKPNDTHEHRGTVHKADWEREGGPVDAAPPAPAQVGTGNARLDQSIANAQAASQANNVQHTMAINNNQAQWAQDEIPPANVYDEDIPF